MRPHLNSNELLLANPHSRFQKYRRKKKNPAAFGSKRGKSSPSSGRLEVRKERSSSDHNPGHLFPSHTSSPLMESVRPWRALLHAAFLRAERRCRFNGSTSAMDHRNLEGAFQEKKNAAGAPGSTDSLCYAWLLTQINRRCIFREQFGTWDLFLQRFQLWVWEVTAPPLIYSTRCFTLSLSPGTKPSCFFSDRAQAAFNPCSWKVLCSWKLLLLCFNLRAMMREVLLTGGCSLDGSHHKAVEGL